MLLLALGTATATGGCSLLPGKDGATASPSPTPPPDVHLTIGYGGDVLMHVPVMDDTEDGQGDIAPLTAAAQPWTSGVDLALCGMEVPVSPTGVVSGFPTFGTLPGVVTALKSTGWDGCATASNHSWDQGMDGVVTTADTLQENGLGWSGTNRTQAEADRPYQIYELQREGRTVRVAQLSTTYGLNGFAADPQWAVNLNDVEWAARQARAARDAGADIVVLHSQIGEEYTSDPVAEQTEYAQAIADTGEIDLLFSAHPHVPQTNELLKGGPDGAGMWVSYSAGNFISNQSPELGNALAGTGTFVWVDVTVGQAADGTDDVHLPEEEPHAVPVEGLIGDQRVREHRAEHDDDGGADPRPRPGHGARVVEDDGVALGTGQGAVLCGRHMAHSDTAGLMVASLRAAPSTPQL